MAEIGRLPISPGLAASARSAPQGLPALSTPTGADPPRQAGIYAWIERAHTEGIEFPLREYNARIPQDTVEQLMRPPAEAELPAPWSGHFRPASEDEILALLSGSE